MILLIDNYDSFVYNLARYTAELGFAYQVTRNDEITIDQIQQLSPTQIILSPGPCTPNEAGICIDLIKTFGPTIPILGVCLGHQAIGQAFGGSITTAIKPSHGKASMINHNGQQLFQELPNPLQVARYHSLVVDKQSLPQELEITSTCKDGDIMALKHKTYNTYGVQFHPESVLTKHGKALLNNFLRVA